MTPQYLDRPQRACPEQTDGLASGIAACSFLENSSSKQLHTRRCTSFGPQQYTRQAWRQSDERLSK